MKPDKLVILGPHAKLCHVISNSMRISIEHAPSEDPAFDGVYVRVETFIPDGTTDKVFYPYRKPTEAVTADVRAVTEREAGPFPGPGMKPYVHDTADAESAAQQRETDDMDAKLDEHEREHQMMLNRNFGIDLSETDDPEFQMYLGEWMKWAEEHSDQVHPCVLAAVKRSIRDQSKEFDGNMERIPQGKCQRCKGTGPAADLNKRGKWWACPACHKLPSAEYYMPPVVLAEVPSPAGAEFLCDNEKCDTMVPDGEGGYCLEERLCPDCLEAAMHVIKQCDHPFCRKDVPEHLAHYVDGGRWRYCRFHAELHDHAEVYDE